MITEGRPEWEVVWIEKNQRWSTSGLHTRPLLFIIFIDDISQDLKNQSILFADDATLMSLVKSSEDRLPAAASLNQDLHKI